MNRMFGKSLKAGLAASLLLAAALPVVAAAADMKSWQREVAQTVASKQVYPRSALRKELEGSAKVRITMDRTGAISNFELIEGTGHDELDREVPKLIERINPLPSPPAELADADLTFILPLAWALQ